MKRQTLSLLLVFVLAFSFFFPVYAAATLDKTNVEKGVIVLQLVNSSNKKMKAIIEKDSNKYTYTLRARASESFPLQMGPGVYTLTTLENVTGNQYKQLSKETIDMSNANENVVFLNSIQLVEWTSTMKAIDKATELTAGLSTEDEKFDAIYNYMTANFAYDFDKISSLPADYIPDTDTIFNLKKGICYDYSCVTGAMLRSVGIPAKLVMGYTEYVDEYHAWNEVYLASQKKWCVVDTTVDAQYVAAKVAIDKIKADSKYKKVKEY